MFEIGVDIGGTNIKYGLVNEALEIVAHGSIPFPKTTAEDMADKLAAALRAMLAEQGVTEIGSIGIVVPGSIDRSGEVVIAAYNLGFDFVGCEIDREYYEKQEERFAAHTAQMSLFTK